MTTWFNKSPGQEVGIKCEEDESILEIMSLGYPDWIRTPPDLGSRKLCCLSVEIRKCIVNDHEHPAQHYSLEEGLFCCECILNQQFYWYKK